MKVKLKFVDYWEKPVISSEVDMISEICVFEVGFEIKPKITPYTKV